MIKFNKFTGVNNVIPSYKLDNSSLVAADNVDFGPDGEVTRRDGFSEELVGVWKDLWERPGYVLASDGQDLVKLSGGVVSILSLSIGPWRVWYCDLPDGRVAFSNGFVSGITDGVVTTQWGVPTPSDVGAASSLSGELHNGEYRWAVTYVRATDGLEGAPTYSEPFSVDSGGIFISSIPMIPGHTCRVYLSSGEEFFYAGASMTGSFAYLGKNESLTLPLATADHLPMPAGILPTFWRGRVLIASGNTLWASLPYSPEHCDMARDFKQLESKITAIVGVSDGVFVGTEDGLIFLSGTQFDKLEHRVVSEDPVVLGSAVTTSAERLKPREGGNYRGEAMICICGGGIVFGYVGGAIWRVTEGIYKTDVTEVIATLRESEYGPQYLATPL